MSARAASPGGEPMTAEPWLPDRLSLSSLKAAAKSCRGCPLWRPATQTVFGEGRAHATLMLVGEQPGDVEDRRGKPFVGPSGRLLDDALEEAGIDRRLAYVTNAVKHFKFEVKGNRRYHKAPNALEVKACRPWLDAELEVIRPRVVVALGATAAQRLIGPDFLVSKRRGTWVESDLAPHVTATVHPSSILRSRTSTDRKLAMRAFVADLEEVRRILDADREEGNG